MSERDPIFQAIADYKRAERRSSALFDALDAAEAEAKRLFGLRPCTLIGWRHYGSIGGAEIERARDEFLLSPGANRKEILAEYEDAKARERAAKSEVRAWYRRTGLASLKREQSDARSAEQQALLALARTRPQTPAGAAEILAFLRRDMKVGEHRWQDIALGTIVDVLNTWDGAAAA
ncbi:MAG TPA: hypothetical protein EYP98_04045 [Planctomycetes bacterium]|nr:hypothetical protein [Planctomycetota bacterium]